MPFTYFWFQFSSVAQSCPTPCNPMNCSTPGLPVHHQLPKFTQTHIHRVKCMLMIYPQSSSKKSFKLLHCFQKKIQSDLRVRHNLVPIYLFNLICYHFNQSIPLTYQALSCPRTFAHTSPCVWSVHPPRCILAVSFPQEPFPILWILSRLLVDTITCNYLTCHCHRVCC